MNLQTAIEFAKAKHRGQKRKGGSLFSLHLFRVAERLQDAGFDEDYQIVAWLHDILEDADATLDDLYNLKFSDEIVEAVNLLTKSDNLTYDEYLQQIKTRNNDLAIKVKIFDMIDNISDNPTEWQLHKYSFGLRYLIH